MTIATACGITELESKDLVIPGFILLETNRWALPQYLTVAKWRSVWRSSLKGKTKRDLMQFRAATLLLELAEEYGLPEAAVLIKELDQHSTSSKPDLHLVPS
jgi:hypothetical protein